MRVGAGNVAARPGRFMRNVSVASRLSMVVVIVALVSVVVTSLVGLQRGRQLSDDMIHDQLVAIGAARANEVERYAASLDRAVVGQAISPRSAIAIADLGKRFRQFELDGASDADRRTVDDFYRSVVAPDLSDVRGVPVNASGLIPVSEAAKSLQAAYVVPEEMMENRSEAMSEWAEVNDHLDDSFREFVLRTNLDDFYLIKPEEHVVVYSTAKAIDFGTSLTSGPHSGSALAALINRLSDSPVEGSALIRDFAAYAPAGDRASAFVASPVFANGRLAGYVAIRFGSDELSSITTNDENWSELGTTGEAYVVAGDNRMRSEARGFLEDQGAFLEAARETGSATDAQIRSMDILDTTVLIQSIDYDQVDQALNEAPSVVETKNYESDEVLSSRRALDIDGLNWAVFAEVGIDEIEQPINDFNRNLLIAIAIFIVIVTFLAVRWSDRVVEPLRIIADRLRQIRRGGDVYGKTDLPDHSSREFVELGDDIDTMLRTLQMRGLDASSRAAERRRVLRRLLPPQIAERAEAGDRDVVDQIPVATVAVIVIHGLGTLIGDGSSDLARQLLDQFVDDADDAAKLRGLERVRLTGDAYFAVCGATRMHLDHASRAASFVLDIVELFEDLVPNDDVTMAAGLDSGPITVGLTGGNRLVHDTWGPTVRKASDLARTARPGEILVTAALRSQLSGRYRVEDLANGDGAGVLMGIVEPSEPAS